MKLQNQINHGRAVIGFVSSTNAGDVSLGNMLRFPGTISQRLALPKNAAPTRNEALGLAERPARWEHWAYVALEICAFVAVVIALVRAWG
jgi:hypothetical protein